MRTGANKDLGCEVNSITRDGLPVKRSLWGDRALMRVDLSPQEDYNRRDGSQ
jgi:hypothetical protein